MDESEPDWVKRVLIGLVVIFFIMWRGASGTVGTLSAEQARLHEERGTFVLSLVEWNIRLADKEPAWLPADLLVNEWTFGYTSLDPLPRGPLEPLPVLEHAVTFTASAPFVFPPAKLIKGPGKPHVIGIEVTLVRFTDEEEGMEMEPRFGWWKADELSMLGGEELRLVARAPTVREREYVARVYYFLDQ